MRKPRLTHLDARGRAKMVDVSEKPATKRRAVASGKVHLGAASFRALAAGTLAKGDAIAVARLAGIQAAKRTADWIPLCHPVPLERVDVEIELRAKGRIAEIVAVAEARWSTGVEMEALVAVAAAALALYDMTKGVDRANRIGEVLLVEKTGGRSGSWRRGR